MSMEQDRRIRRAQQYDEALRHKTELMDTAQAVHNTALKSAKECRLVGPGGVIDASIEAALLIERAAKEIENSGLFTDIERDWIWRNIFDTQIRYQNEIYAAVEQGCPCAKPFMDSGPTAGDED